MTDEHKDEENRVPSEDRAAKFAQGAPGIPRKAIFIAVGAFVVLGLGGVMGDHFFGGPVSDATATTSGTNPPPLQTTTSRPKPPASTGSSSALPASVASLLGATKLPSNYAPDFTLETARGPRLSLASLRGEVVVLSFFDSRCDDICPVLASELRSAVRDLGPAADRVEFLTVNTDPLAASPASARSAEAAAGLGTLDDWHFLTGSVAQLDTVWKSYGVSIEAQASTGLVSHNEVLYFIDPEGRLRWRATPFGNESDTGSFSLPTSTEALYGSGIALYARSLLGPATGTGS